jgi:hypothetical protein
VGGGEFIQSLNMKISQQTCKKISDLSNADTIKDSRNQDAGN